MDIEMKLYAYRWAVPPPFFDNPGAYTFCEMYLSTMDQCILRVLTYLK